MRVRFVVREPAEGFAPREPPARALYRIIESYEALVLSAFLKAVADTRRALDLSEVAEAAGSSNVDKVLQATGWEDIGEKLLWDRVPELFRDAMEDGGNLAARYLAREFVMAGRHTLDVAAERLASKKKPKPSLTDKAVKANTLRFDIVNPRAVEWVRQHSGQLITSITRDTLTTVRRLTERSFTEGIPPRALARQIEGVIGMTPDQQASIERLERRLRRDGVPQSAIDEKVAAETRRKIAIRAESISRTEIVGAAHEGQDLLWRQAVDEELVEPARAREEWLVTDDDRLCTICEPLDGATASIGEAFPGGYHHPPDPHPQCRCSKVLLPFAAN